MRWTIALAALLAANPAHAQGVAIASAVYRETGAVGAMQVEPAKRLVPGDRIVAVLRWDAPAAGTYTVVSAVPAHLRLESASFPDLDVSTDGGRHWRHLADPEVIPAGTTHLRWQVGGEGRLSYRAVVR